MNETWWYMSVAIIVIFLCPWLIRLYRKWGIGICVLFLLLPYDLSMDRNWLIQYLGTLMVGILFAEENILERMKAWSLKSKIGTFGLKMLGCVAGTALCCYIRFNIDVLWTLMNLALALIFIYFCYEFLTDIKMIRNVLEFLGKHSMNIFLIHTMIFSYYFKNQIFSLKYAVFLILTVLILSLMASMAVECLKKKLMYNNVINWFCEKVEIAEIKGREKCSIFQKEK